MPALDLKYAFGLKPEQAIEYFQAKAGDLVATWDWHEMLDEAHARAFTVAKAMRTDILQDIHGELRKAMDEGTAFAAWKKNLVPRLKAKGWWGEVVNEATGEIANVGPWRLRTIYETNIQTSYQVGHYRRMMENAADRPWWMYVAVMDRRTRPAHAALNGLTFRFDDPFWNTHYPPSGFRCRCSVRALTDDGLESKVKAGEAARRSTVGPDADATLEKVEKPLDREGQRMYQAVTVKTTGLNGEKFAMAPDAGWSYNPGKAALAKSQSLAGEKAITAIPSVRGQLLADLNQTPLDKVFRAWGEGILADKTPGGLVKTRGAEQAVGHFTAREVERLGELGRLPATTAITIRDDEWLHLQHAETGGKFKRGFDPEKHLTQEEALSLPQLLRKRKASVWDRNSESVLCVFDVEREGKIGKIAVKVNFRNVKTGEIGNQVRSAGKIEAGDIKAGKRYQLLDGEL